MGEVFIDNTWLFGANFIPSNAINQIEMWQDDTFSINLIKSELLFAKSIGMNVMRVFLHDLLWEQDANGLLSKMDEYLTVSDSLGIKTMFVFFDDCWNDTCALGKQPEPIPDTHNSGWVRSPGTKAADDLTQRPRLEKYVKGVLTHFKDDKRIIAWDLYNEAGNSSAGDHITKTGMRENLSLPLLLDAFKWAKEVSPSQPCTSGIWNKAEQFCELNEACLKYSDIVSFHCYNPKEAMADFIKELKDIADGRPIICTEYMARHIGSNFADILPLLKENGVGAINWGVVSGKTQTYLPWRSYQKEDRHTKPFHDIFTKDGKLLVPEEQEIFNRYTVK